MATHLEDEEQLENLQRWWRENWVALVVGIGIGLGAIGGWEGWQRYRDARAETASHLFEDMKRAAQAGKSDEAEAAAAELMASHGDSPYATAAALALAEQAAGDGQWDTAQTHLRWVVDNGHDQGVKHLAALRLARLLWQQGDGAAALATLERETAAFAPLYDELRGDILQTQGDRDGARAAYERALAGAAADTAQRDLLQRKLDDLAAAGEKASS